MTDPTPTPTRADWETLVAHNKALIDRNVALRERAEAAERRAYDLAVAIMGGEDAPGYADSIPTQVLVDQQREMVQEWLHRVTPDEARRAEAAAWNDAIEAAGNLESIHGYSNAVPRHRIRALRRAAPTEGEA